MKLIKDGFAPTASFVDVFTAHPLIDYYDEDGRFYTKMECAKGWGDCFDYIRETLGDNAPTTCEAGHDGLVGHVDGVQSDHYAAKHWNWKCADAERTPWHDMATHGSMVLLAGGLGPRYSGGEPYSGWDSDDYLSNTVMGGRNPMSQGPCTRGTVMTYWLQHDICRELARQSLETHEFVGDDIHRQHTTFGGGGQVWANRGTTPWKVGNTVLPRFGFLARSGQVTAEVSERDGIRTGYASSPGVTFVDARPFAIDFAGHAPVKTRVLSGKHLGGGQVECEVEWEVLQPVPQGNVIFVHVSHDKAVDQGSERIVLHPPMELPADALQRPGVHRGKIRFTLPANGWEGEYRLRYGLYSPTGGGRLMPIAYMDDSRVRGGIFTVTKKDGAYDVQYTPELPPADAPRQNLEGKVVNFGAITTNGAFRLLHAGSEWKLLPLQGSLPFRADLNLAGLGAKGRRLASVEGITQEGKPLGAVAFAQEGDVVKMDLDAKAFGYRLRLR